MTSKNTIRINSKVSDMSEGMKSLVGKKMSKNIKFMNQDLTIKKLSVSEVLKIQEMAKDVGEDENANFGLLMHVVRASAHGADELTEEDFNEFPIDDLSKLSNEIMKYSGMGAAEQGKGK